MAEPTSALALATAYRDAFFARDVDAIMDLVTPDFVFENVTGGERIEGREAARHHIAALHARWPDLAFEEREGGLTAGDAHAVAEWTARATHPDTGRRIEWDGMDLILVRDGRISRNAVYSSAHAARDLASR
ncbi:MAG TPA: nuclear transport factor 2 family protein [Gaiellales bacterium]|nr:nuclear transport factor 2 family protein [Gaiellales bacterium]